MAIASILGLEAPCAIHVVIVDNGSTAPGRESLEAEFASLRNIHFVSTGENLGFARGNNFGYDYAKRALKSHFIVVANNDVTWPDGATVTKLLSFYSKSHYAILGPNIEVRGERNTVYQNPMRRALQTKTEASLSLKKYGKVISGIEAASLKPPKVLGSRKKARRQIEGEVILHGSAYVFSPAFVCFRDRVFDERTFLYGEEALLALNAIAEGYKMVYAPQFLALHHAKASTNLDNLEQFYVRSAKWHSQAITAYIDCIGDILNSGNRV
jgi:GT2 family glycosyltransferase